MSHRYRLADIRFARVPWTTGYRVVATTVVVGLSSLLTATVGADAQEPASPAILPDGVFFDPPVASPREARFVLQLVQTDLLETQGDERVPFEGDDLDDELQVIAGLGGTLPLWRFASWEDGGMSLALQTGVFGRFRAEKSTNDLIASDWLVGFPVDLRIGRWVARARWYHWSAHLGDEFIETTGAQRIDFTHEALELLTAYRAGRVRLYGGGAWITRSQLGDEEDTALPDDFSDDAALQVGSDVYVPLWADGKAGVVAAGGVQWEDRTEWEDRVSLLVGLERRGGPLTGRFTVNYQHGPSPLGQFFRTEESMWGFGFRIEL